jgi:CDP-6-deoxy-D-xylo-4-hexulose-3-dehydrase
LRNKKIKALFLTNLLGFCSDLDEIQKICEQKKILLIEDNCEALGSVYKKRKLGNWSFASTFSFYVGHHMSTVEGGMVCTDNERISYHAEISESSWLGRNLSVEKQQKFREKHQVNSSFYSRLYFYHLGTIFRTTEINGFLGNINN